MLLNKKTKIEKVTKHSFQVIPKISVYTRAPWLLFSLYMPEKSPREKQLRRCENKKTTKSYMVKKSYRAELTF